MYNMINAKADISPLNIEDTGACQYTCSTETIVISVESST